MANDFFEYRLNELKEKYPSFLNYQDYHLFTLLCIKYFFYSETGEPFDQDIVKTYITDGANDGGIDAIFNDPTSEGNDVIIIQSKYYSATPLSADNIVGEAYKISETLKKLRENKISGFNDNLVTAYRNATSNMEDNGGMRVFFFTSYTPRDKRERNKMERSVQKYFPELEFEMNFAPDIEAQIEMCDNGKATVDSDQLEIDNKDNVLTYEDSIIVNVSALSLQELYNRRRNGLLGMNLRFYVKQKAVDHGIETTIGHEPENFWYKNNGIIITCDNFKLDGKKIKLHNFSIVNGGQTTNRIGKSDIEKDFYLLCKVVKAKGDNENAKNGFINNIAEATNSQKPIKKADLKANTPEQIDLKQRLSREHVYYITKKGDKTPRQYSAPYESVTLEKIGKISLAAMLQMPGSARSNSQRMFASENYYDIFGPSALEGAIADVLKIGWYYDQFLKTDLSTRGFDEQTVLPMIKNGRTFQYACICFLCKINYEVFLYDTIGSFLSNPEELKRVLRQNGDVKRIITKKLDDEQDIFFKIFSVIGEEVLGYCFGNALSKATDEQRIISASDYLKLDTNYYKDVIKRLWSRYNQNENLKNGIKSICGKI